MPATPQTSTPEQIRGTVALLRHFRAFLASPYQRMRDPYDRATWGNLAETLDHPAAQARLTWLTRVAILRRAGWIDDAHSRELAPGLNHRGIYPRYRTGDAQRHLGQLAARINQPRLIVRRQELGEWSGYFSQRLTRRLTTGRLDD